MNEACYYRVSVKGVVIDENGRVLLTRQDNNKWDMLGGGLDYGEDPKDCLRREVYEEAGLTVTNISERPMYFLTVKRESRDSYLANIIYQITLENLDFTPSEECQELRFFTPEEMDSIELFPNVRALRQLLTN